MQNAFLKMAIALLAGLLAGSAFAFAQEPQAAVPSKDGKPVQTASLASPHSSESRTRLNPRRMTLIKRQWGIDVMDVHLTSGGYMLEFRYRVLEPKKAAMLFDRKIKPVLVDSVSGAKVVVPSPEKVGQLRNVNPPEAGKVYWMLFANPGQIIKAGNRISISIGEFQLKDMVVN